MDFKAPPVNNNGETRAKQHKLKERQKTYTLSEPPRFPEHATRAGNSRNSRPGHVELLFGNKKKHLKQCTPNKGSLLPGEEQ